MDIKHLKNYLMNHLLIDISILQRKSKARHGLIEYSIPHKYHPDFLRIIDDSIIYLEAKGRFWDYQEYNKFY